MPFVVCGGDGEWIRTGFSSAYVVVLVSVCLGWLLFCFLLCLFVCLLACMR